MSNRTTTSDTRPQNRTVPPFISNTQTVFHDDLHELESIENDPDENSPLVADVPFYNQSQNRLSGRRYVHNRNPGTYYTPQVKRKDVHDPMGCSPMKKKVDAMEHLLLEVNRKLDLFQKKDVFEKKFDTFYKRVRDMFHEKNKYPVPNEPPSQLPIILYNDQNILSRPLPTTPAILMKRLINQMFSKEEMMQRLHEESNERTEKIKEAVREYFYSGDEQKATAFWDNEGKVIRQNQRRGLLFRHGRSDDN